LLIDINVLVEAPQTKKPRTFSYIIQFNIKSFDGFSIDLPVFILLLNTGMFCYVL